MKLEYMCCSTKFLLLSGDMTFTSSSTIQGNFISDNINGLDLSEVNDDTIYASDLSKTL